VHEQLRNGKKHICTLTKLRYFIWWTSKPLATRGSCLYGGKEVLQFSTFLYWHDFTIIFILTAVHSNTLVCYLFGVQSVTYWSQCKTCFRLVCFELVASADKMVAFRGVRELQVSLERVICHQHIRTLQLPEAKDSSHSVLWRLI